VNKPIDLANEFDVAVVGYGPTGGTLACLLARSGLSVLLLERQTEIYDLPRAVHFDDETIRVFQAAGFASGLSDCTRVNPGMKFVAPDGSLLLNWPRPREKGCQGWHASYRFHQPALERVLRRHVATIPKVTAMLGANVKTVADLGDSVETVFHLAGANADFCARSKFVVGCDGANSTVRNQSEADYEDLGFRERWLVVDALLTRPKPELGDFSIQFCDPVRPATYCRNVGDRRRWEISLLDTESPDDFADPDSAWKFLEKWISPRDAEIERCSVYEFRSAVARKWHIGRILLAGDAAHLTPPFMGQGMCAGIRDASNLAWKLALCARHGYCAELLDSYETERKAHVRKYIETAVELGGLINGTGAGLASEAGTGSSGTKRMKSLSIRLDPGLASRFCEHSGRLFPQPKTIRGELLDDVVGYRCVLLAQRDFAETASEIAPGLQVINADASPDIGDCLAELGARAVFLRPDRYIFGSARSSSELARLLEAAIALRLA